MLQLKSCTIAIIHMPTSRHRFQSSGAARSRSTPPNLVVACVVADVRGEFVSVEDGDPGPAEARDRICDSVCILPPSWARYALLLGYGC